ncbi:hypothetical protein [Roseateles paludis]|uniref:Lipoprotein n=1 Tax=Roseateles paludis TaxID=3145238 RepID=A0ABV0G2A5_9BURK
MPRMAVIAALFATAVAAAPFGAEACSATGAYGFSFGAKPAADAKRLRGGNASVWYAVQAPKPDERFDRYEVRTDTKTGEIYEIDAIRTIAPMASAPKLTAEDRAQNVQRAHAFVAEYRASLPPETQALLADKYRTSNWQGSIADGLWLEMSATAGWEVTVVCRDLRRELGMARRVLPEMFEQSK